ncbi:MAG TPA: hypothetical protein VIY49_12810 [Bryobacteraceae bacterium]
MKLLGGIVACISMGLAAGAASRYTVTFGEQAEIAGQIVKPGEYRVEVEGNKATLKGTGKSVETGVRVVEGDAKFSRTSVRYSVAGGKYRVEQIQIGGTKTTLIFEGDSGSKAAQPAGVR